MVTKHYFLRQDTGQTVDKIRRFISKSHNNINERNIKGFKKFNKSIMLLIFAIYFNYLHIIQIKIQHTFVAQTLGPNIADIHNIPIMVNCASVTSIFPNLKVPET